MQKNSQDFSMEQAKNLLASPAGQQLIGLLQQQDPGALQKAADLASSGDLQGAGKALSALMRDERVQKLAKQLEGK